MAKRKTKRNRLAGIHIPDELKRKAVCVLCKQYIKGTVKDPVISAPSLGKGSYHYECALLVWSELKKIENKEKE